MPAHASVAMTPATVNGTILRAQSGFYAVLADDGSIVTAQLRGLLTNERQASDLAVIGDRGRVALQPDGNGAIEHVEERTSKVSRRQPGPRGGWQEEPLVRHVDRVLIVFACADPMPHVRMLDRFLVVAEHNEVPDTIVANKGDLVGLEEGRAAVERE